MLKGSYKTTGAGIAVILTALASALTAMTDNDPNTNPDWLSVGAAISAGVGLMVARDNDKTSNDVGAVDKPTTVPPPPATKS